MKFNFYINFHILSSDCCACMLAANNTQGIKPLPAFMRQRHITKRGMSDSIVCTDNQFEHYVFYVPKKWGLHWFFGYDAPLREDGNPVQLEEMTLFCYIGKTSLDPTMILSLDVGDVLTLQAKKNNIRHSHNSQSCKNTLLVQIEDINFSPSGRQAEISVKHV